MASDRWPFDATRRSARELSLREIRHWIEHDFPILTSPLALRANTFDDPRAWAVRQVKEWCSHSTALVNQSYWTPWRGCASAACTVVTILSSIQPESRSRIDHPGSGPGTPQEVRCARRMMPLDSTFKAR